MFYQNRLVMIITPLIVKWCRVVLTPPRIRYFKRSGIFHFCLYDLFNNKIFFKPDKEK